MKKFIVSLFAFFAFSSLFAQKVNFQLQWDGSILTDKNEKYAVVFFEGKSKSELYKMVKTNVVQAYVSAKDVISFEEDEIVSVRGYQPEVFLYKALGMVMPYGMTYTIKFLFKDGKIRIEPEILSWDYNNHDKIFDNNAKSLKEAFLFNRKKEPKEKVEQVNNFFNSLTERLIQGKATDNEDW